MSLSIVKAKAETSWRFWGLCVGERPSQGLSSEYTGKGAAMVVSTWATAPSRGRAASCTSVHSTIGAKQPT